MQPSGRKPAIRADKQGKHIPGHSNFQPGKSEWTHPDPQALLDQFGGTGIRDAQRELVDFGAVMGFFALFLLGRCWSLSEEDEDCADWAREHLQREHVREMVRRLAGSADPRTRWQTCDVLGNLLSLDAATLRVLETALEDSHAYVRRRAFLALTRHVGGVDPQPYVRRMLLDTDSYNRYVAVQTYYPDAVPEALQAQVNAAAQDPTVVRLLVSEE